VNTAAEALFRTNRDEIKKFSADAIARFLAANNGDSLPPVVNRSLHGESVHQERRVVGIPSQSVSAEVLLSASPIRDIKGRIVGALVIVRDVTELSMLQRLMAETERQNAIGKMAAALSHDFNNVLQTISQAVSVLEMDASRSGEERNVILRMIRNAVKRGVEITSSVRQYLTNGAQESNSLDVNEVLEQTIELTRPLWQASHNIAIVREFQPVCRIHSNATELRRIFTNLVINALEAMPQGGTLTIGCEQLQRSVRVFVEDTGEGIPEERRNKIFLPYFTTKRGGTGLGLANAQKTVSDMGGRMEFSSEVGKGTRFQIELPKVETQAQTS
jgi:signal transduction histidine kinase